MAYLGLAPSAHASGDGWRQGGITKAGEAAARRMLFKAAWKAKLRFSRRHRRPAHRGKQQPWQPRRRLMRQHQSKKKGGAIDPLASAAAG